MGPLIPWFWTSDDRCPGRVDPSLTYFIACMQWIPQIHLWCNTCRLLVSSMAYKLLNVHSSLHVVGLKPGSSVRHSVRSNCLSRLKSLRLRQNKAGL